MLKVLEQQYIKFLREHEGCSITEIADRLNLNWRTAKKYTDKDDWNETMGKRFGRYSVLGPFLTFRRANSKSTSKRFPDKKMHPVLSAERSSSHQKTEM